MFCNSCDKRKTCRAICKPLAKYLRDDGIYSADFIRPEISSAKRKDGFGKHREIPFSAMGEKFKRKIGDI